MTGPQRRDLRVGHAERQVAADELAEHFAMGRLNPDELDERTGAVWSAQTQPELDGLFHDLPRAAPDPPTDPPADPPPAALVPARAAGPPAPASPADLPAPYGREPGTGLPYSDRYRLLAGVLQIVLPFGPGRFYSGQYAVGRTQLLLVFLGVGVLWSLVDGVALLCGARILDDQGRPLR